jgi:HSP20 family protein
MNLVRWDPFRDDTTFANWEPPVDIQENEKEFILKADLPDVKKEDVKVEFDDGVLTVEGDRKQEKEEKGKRFHKIERSYGRFVRRFALPTDVDGVHAKAEFKDGVLHVHLPKTATAKATTIEVKVA